MIVPMKPLTTRQAADELGVTERRILRLIQEGRIKATRPGRDWFIDAAAWKRFKAKHDPRPGRRPAKAKR